MFACPVATSFIYQMLPVNILFYPDVVAIRCELKIHWIKSYVETFEFHVCPLIAIVALPRQVIDCIRSSQNAFARVQIDYCS